MDTKNDPMAELLVTNTTLTIRLIRSVSALIEIMRETVPDFNKRYLAALFPPQEEQGVSKVLAELAETAQRLAQASCQLDKA